MHLRGSVESGALIDSTTPSTMVSIGNSLNLWILLFVDIQFICLCYSNLLLHWHVPMSFNVMCTCRHLDNLVST